MDMWRHMGLLEIQVVAFAGFIAGMIVWPMVLRWPLALVEATKSVPPPRAPHLILTSLLHSGVWILGLAVALTYYIYVRYQALWTLWFLGSFYVCLFLFGVLLIHLIRLDFNAPERQKRSPVPNPVVKPRSPEPSKAAPRKLATGLHASRQGVGT